MIVGDMLIHAYLTDGFYPWAKFFLKSFGRIHGEEIKIVLSTRDLAMYQILELQLCYKNLVVQNEKLDYAKAAKRSGLSIPYLKELKNEVETKHVTEKNVIWKQFIAVEDRARDSIIGVMEQFPDTKYIIHFDIDLYFRKPIVQLCDIIADNDISIRFRLKSRPNRKVMINKSITATASIT